MSVDIIPGAVVSHLVQLGANLRIARERRRESLQAMSARVGCSIPTLRRMEAGDPSVAMGVYASALWVFDSSSALGGILEPGDDAYATMLDVDRASRRRRSR